jgi:hypothetical protein
VPFHALLFRFWIEMVEPASITSHDIEQEVIILGSMLSAQL